MKREDMALVAVTFIGLTLALVITWALGYGLGAPLP
jgi:hypothetical protein